MLNIAVVDDEGIIREQIKDLIKTRKSDSDVDTYSAGEEFLAVKKEYDVIFLDIQMDGINGIETARKIRKQREEIICSGRDSMSRNDVVRKDSVIVFVTGVKEHVFDAFDVAAFHYLLKPIEEKKFLEVFERAITEVEKRKKQVPAQLFLKTRTRNVTLNQNSILYIESRGKKVEVHTTNEMIEVYAAIRDLEKQLDVCFYRCHRGYLVNMAHIAEYTNESITLCNGECILLAKEKYGEFVKVYMRYLRNGGVAGV